MLTSLTCGWAIACHHDDDAALPPKAGTVVPNVSADPLPVTTYERPDTGPTADPTLLTVAVDIDPTVSADTWLVTASIEGDIGPSLNITGHQDVLQLVATSGSAESVRIELIGKTRLSDGTDYTLGHRVVTTHFVPHEHRMVYLFVDQQCAYSAVGATDGGSGCANANEWCYEGKCRPEALPAAELPVYRDNWREQPPSPCPSPSPQVSLAEGFSSIVPKNDGDTVTIECGPQGGHHIWVAALTTGLDQRGPLITVTAPATDAGAALITSYPLVRLYASENASDAGAEAGSAFEACEAKGIQFQLDPDGRSVQPYLGKPIDITLALQDKNGQKAQVTRHLNVAPKLSTTSCFGP